MNRTQVGGLRRFGRVLAAPVTSTLRVPPADNTSMDGYAMRAADVPAEGTRLPVSQRIPAGHVGTELAPGTAARIFTGGLIPPGADAVVMQEQCQADGDAVVVNHVPASGEWIRRAGEDIEEVAERFWHLAEHMTEGFVLSTNEGIIFLVNKQFVQMTGLTEEEVIGQNSRDLAQRLNISNMQEHLQKRAQGEATEYEVTWRVNGEERRLWFSGTPIWDEHGRHTANLATVRDITEFHRLSQRVERHAAVLLELGQDFQIEAVEFGHDVPAGELVHY